MTVRALLRWIVAPALMMGAALCLLAAPATGGLTLIVGIPLGLAGAWFFRNDPADRDDISRGGVVALGIAVAAIGWVVFTLTTSRTIWGGSQ